ncbi:hypothetical protein KGF54_004703 [Candida jiufengensis]|uniref:uncharacterized protein n=1 Tax=Candida jiufengensis TaxID=497108 RepID=UPI0022244B85|nr:uncharacterized protein KGF54_004703 [Candida jiufengensis]KAI5951629.1 hypothetical protein KGF54_004703 [Candida jiufengensis]
MGIEEFTYKPNPKNIIIALITEEYPSISCEGDEKVELYIIKNAFYFKSFTSKLLQKNTNSIIIIEFESLQSISEWYHIFHDLNKVDESEYKLQQLIIISIDPKYLSELTIQSTRILQLLRIMSLKHGCAIISIRNLLNYLKTHKIEKLTKLNKVSVKPNFEESTIHDDDFLLYIPSSWDSWNKIIVHGKSTLFSDDDRNDGIIRDEKQLQELDSKYEDFLSNDDPTKDWSK